MKSISNAFLRRLSGLAPAVATCGAVASACVGLLGYAVLTFLFLTRYYAPAAHNYVRPLHFDYSGFIAVAVAPLSPSLRELPPAGHSKALAGAAAAVLPKSRFLPSGSQVAVHVWLYIPWDHTDLFQVTGELLSNASHVAARSTRTYINTPQPYAYRVAKQLLMLPLHVMGWGHGDWVRVNLALFDSYEERDDAPVTVFRARLASRNASRGGLPPPPVHRAEVHVRLRLGLLQTALFWLRPGLVSSLVLLALGLSASSGGTACALALGLLACLLQRWMKSALARSKQQVGLLPIAPAPRAKHFLGEQPYGSLEDAVSYSLANAHVIRDRDLGPPAPGAADDDDAISFANKPYDRYGQHSNNIHNHNKSHKVARQDSTSSDGRLQAGVDGADAAASGGDDGSPAVRLGAAESPGWSGSSGVDYTAGLAVSAAGPAQRQGSGAEVSRSTAITSAAVETEGGLPAGVRSKVEGLGQDQLEGGARRGQGVEGSKRESGTSGYDLYEDADSEDDGQGWEAKSGKGIGEEGGQEEDVCAHGAGEAVDGGRDGGGGGAIAAEGRVNGGQGDGDKARPQGGEEGRCGDVHPQADNMTEGVALRKRTVFAWKA